MGCDRLVSSDARGNWVIVITRWKKRPLHSSLFNSSMSLETPTSLSTTPPWSANLYSWERTDRDGASVRRRVKIFGFRRTDVEKAPACSTLIATKFQSVLHLCSATDALGWKCPVAPRKKCRRAIGTVTLLSAFYFLTPFILTSLFYTRI